MKVFSTVVASAPKCLLQERAKYTKKVFGLRIKSMLFNLH
jgi:hypothetical protein